MAGQSKNVLAYNVKVVEKASAINGRQTEWRINGVEGLMLTVEPSGAARYVYRYSVKVGTKRVFRKIKIGRRGPVTLHDARRRAEDLARSIERDGADPVADAMVAKKALTFDELVAAYEATRGPELSPKVLADYLRAIKKDVSPRIGVVGAHLVTKDHVADIVAEVTSRGSNVMADQTRAAIGSVYSWALKSRVAKGLTFNPATGIAKSATSEGRNRSITASELRDVWQGLDALPPMIHQRTGRPIEGRFHEGLSEAVKTCVRLCWLTGSRRSEVVAAKITEFNIGARVWTIPGKTRVKGKMVGGRTKKGRTKVVPLSNGAIILIKRAMEVGGNSEYLFPSSPNCKLPHLDPHSVTTAIDRVTSRLKIDDLVLHDGRSALRTWLRDSGADASVLDAVLGHAGQSIGARHYEAPTIAFIENRVRPALESWAAYVLRTVEDSPATDNLVRPRHAWVRRKLVRSKSVRPM